MLKAFLFTLALADFGAGAIVHPLHNGNEQAGWFLTDDRDDMPCLRSGRWYCVLVKKKRFVTLLILLWLLTIAGMSLPLWNHKSYKAFANAVLTLFLILTTAPYLKIYPSLKQQNGRLGVVNPRDAYSNHPQRTKFSCSVNRYKQTFYNMFHEFSAFILCYLPFFWVFIAIHIKRVDKTLKMSLSNYNFGELFVEPIFVPLENSWNTTDRFISVHPKFLLL